MPVLDPYINEIRKEFPILDQNIYGHKLSFLDNAASTQKPKIVINSITNYYERDHSNIHRGLYYLADVASIAYEQARIKIKKFINANSEKECIFTKGTTESINLLAYSFGEKYIKAGDEILISTMEHHANIVPWQIVCAKKGAILKVIPITEQGELDLTDLDKLINKNTKIVSIVYASNVLGTINPLKKIISAAHAKNVPVAIDGAQACANFKVDVQDLDCDFFSFSAHKMYGPTGVGLLYGKEKYLANMPPYQTGGSMIEKVTLENHTYGDLPAKFEAGTQSIADAIAFGFAVDFLNSLDFTKIAEHKQKLLKYATDQLSSIKHVKLIGTAANKTPVISFVIKGIHAHDLGTIADQYGVAVRAGHHCCMPLMDFYKLASTTRASFAIYNTFSEIDALCKSILEAKRIFKVH